MSKNSVLSSTYNMSVGFIPIILTILMNWIIGQTYAVYIGLVSSILISYPFWIKKKKRVPNLIAKIVTVVLAIIAISSIINQRYCPNGSLPLTLEVITLIPMSVLFLHKSRFMDFLCEKNKKVNCSTLLQGAESAIVAARIVLILGFVHFCMISLTLITNHSPSQNVVFFLFQLTPLLVFGGSILLNQVGIVYFNKLISFSEYIPIVNNEGKVISKVLLSEIPCKNTGVTYPVIRIATAIDGKILLCEKEEECYNQPQIGKLDIPMESYLRYKETLVEGVDRLLRKTFPRAKLSPLFNFMYHFENATSNKLIYLFFIEIDKETLEGSTIAQRSKPWSFKQIEQNKGMHCFTECFELEYEHLKEIICTREKYKEL